MCAGVIYQDIILSFVLIKLKQLSQDPIFYCTKFLGYLATRMYHKLVFPGMPTLEKPYKYLFASQKYCHSRRLAIRNRPAQPTFRNLINSNLRQFHGGNHSQQGIAFNFSTNAFME